MKHDLDLMQALLEEAAKSSSRRLSTDITPANKEHEPLVHEHIGALLAHDLLKGKLGNHPEEPHTVHGITENGHGFLQAIKNESVRKKIQKESARLGEDISVHIALDVAKAFLVGML